MANRKFNFCLAPSYRWPPSSASFLSMRERRRREGKPLEAGGGRAAAFSLSLLFLPSLFPKPTDRNRSGGGSLLLSSLFLGSFSTFAASVRISGARGCMQSPSSVICLPERDRERESVVGGRRRRRRPVSLNKTGLPSLPSPQKGRIRALNHAPKRRANMKK